MRIRVDHEADAALIDLVEGDKDAEIRTKMCDVEFDRAAVILRLDRDDRLIGFEILGASRLLTEEIFNRED